MKIVAYVYYHFYDIVSRVRHSSSISVNEMSAMLYVALIVFFISMPAAMLCIIKVFGANNKVAFWLFGAAYLFTVRFCVFRYLKQQISKESIKEQFKNETNFQRIIGYVVVIALLISALPIGFLFVEIVK